MSLDRLAGDRKRVFDKNVTDTAVCEAFDALRLVAPNRRNQRDGYDPPSEIG
jgi:hypothetical protein